MPSNPKSHYKLIKFLKSGAHGSCYLYERMDDALRTKVVIKKIPVNDPVKQQQEISILSKCRHPFIIGLFETFTDFESNINIVMQYAEGGNFADFLQQRSQEIPKVFLTEVQVTNYLAQITMALDYLHGQNVIHRDLKPDNILMNRSHKIVKIADFGISRILADGACSKTFIGTSNYVAPEMYMGHAYDKTIDIWSLGCILYEMIELKKAFGGCQAVLVNKVMKADYIHPRECHNDVLMSLLTDCLSVASLRRPSAKDILGSPPVLLAIGRVCSMYDIS